MTMTVGSSLRPRTAGLKRQFLLLVVAIYLVTGGAVLSVFTLVMGNIRQLGEDFAIAVCLAATRQVAGADSARTGAGTDTGRFAVAQTLDAGRT